MCRVGGRTCSFVLSGHDRTGLKKKNTPETPSFQRDIGNIKEAAHEPGCQKEERGRLLGLCLLRDHEQGSHRRNLCLGERWGEAEARTGGGEKRCETRHPCGGCLSHCARITNRSAGIGQLLKIGGETAVHG